MDDPVVCREPYRGSGATRLSFIGAANWRALRTRCLNDLAKNVVPVAPVDKDDGSDIRSRRSIEHKKTPAAFGGHRGD